MLPPPESTRLVTIIAHVDHGKTSLADHLVESNGIIGERLAGTLRYLDSEAEEQRRGITMRASAIGLRHAYAAPRMAHKHKPTGNGGGPAPSASPRDMVIHLIDSPGHVDFSAEVTSSLLLCDAAIIVVDAVEGLCARTHSLVREAFLHQLVPVLVINKVDRLCTQLRLDVGEAYMRIRELIESINAVCAANAAALDDDDSPKNKRSREAVWNFDPCTGNVVFASALHGWGFTLPALARSLFKSKTVPLKPPLLRQYLFGDFKYDADSSKVLKWKPNSANKGIPMFAEFGLGPLWEIYEGVSQAATSVGMKSELFADGVGSGTIQGAASESAKIEATTSGMERVISAIQVGSPSSTSSQPNDDRLLPQNQQELQRVMSRIGAGSESSVVSAVLRRYRPLSAAVLDAVCETGPSPAEAVSRHRTNALTLRTPTFSGDADRAAFASIEDAVRTCDPGAAVAVAHVCKFASTSRASVTDPELPPLPPEADPATSNMIMGIARVLSGTLRTGDVDYYMYGPRYNRSDDNIPKQRIRLYLLMGSSFVHVNSVPAGHICAIYNLEALQLKTVTLCNKRECMPLSGFDFGLQPLVKVNVEPISASDAETLERGLLKLSLADSSVEVTATAKGERILACLGEIHLEQSIHDLKLIYCSNSIKLRISSPIVNFWETTDWFENEGDFDKSFRDKSPPLRQTTISPYCDEEGLGYANRGRCRTILSGRGGAISLRAIPLPRSVYECLRTKQLVAGSEDDLVTVGKALRCGNDAASLAAPAVLDALLDSLDDFDGNGNALLESPALSKGYSVRAVRSTNGEVFVPQKEADKKSEENATAAVDGWDEYQTTRHFLRRGFVCEAAALEKSGTAAADAVALQKWRQDMRGSALAGFQLAMRAGPLCEEPVRSVAVVLESVELAVTDETASDNGSTKHRVAKDLTGGMVVAALRSGVRCALLTRPARLVESHLRLTLHSSFTGLGSLHGILSKRRGKVVTDAMVEGTDLIQITATIPQAESFGLAPELMKKSSGEVTAPELVFSHWEVLDEDPFWIPTTEEEREEYGQNLQTGDSSTGLNNNTLKYIRAVRSRKGLLVDSSKIVVAAEKQRTLSRKK